MKATTAAWPAAATRFLTLRLRPGDDLRASLEATFADVPERAGFVVSGVGSLSVTALRYAGRTDASVTRAPVEVVSLSGTLSPDGVHLHASVAEADGRMIGGHVLPGCVVRTTAEVVLGLADAVSFTRPVDPATGYAELEVS